jgi:hypothetical protein
MQLSVSNIVFVDDKPKPDRPRLIATFFVTLSNDPAWGESITIQDFRYYQPTDGDAYVTGPSIKTKYAVVQPVKFNKEMARFILNRFIAAWEALPKAPSSVQA